MKPALKTIQELLQNSRLSEQEKELFQRAISDADKQWSITEFKLDRTEKVKRTTAILLEETIAELEQKQKAVEAQNRELGIEASLEKVRTVAMSMGKPDDMLLVCSVISEQLQVLNVKAIRNVQTAIFYPMKSTYMNYEYYTKHQKTFITETTYNNNEKHAAFAENMQKGTGQFFELNINGDEVQAWIAYQKTTNVFIDNFLYEASSLNYYWCSLGPVALGMSTYQPLTEDDKELFKRFSKVFELAYTRYLDIEKAEAQAREAQIEAALERVRARAMAMHSSQELQDVVKELRKQIGWLGQKELDTCVIQLYDESPDYIHSYASMTPSGNKEEVREFYRLTPKKGLYIIEEALQAYSSGKKDYVLVNENEKSKQWMNFFKETYPDIYAVAVETLGPKPEEVPAYWSFSDFNGGTLLMVTLVPATGDSRALLRRFADVFGLAYRRFVDLKKAESQSREAQIQLALERVRARTMAMQKSEELTEVAAVLFQQVKELGIEAWTTGFNIWSDDNNFYTDYITNPQGGFMPPYTIDTTIMPVSIALSNAKKRGEDFFVNYEEGEALAEVYRQLSKFGEKQFKSILESGFEFPSHQYEHFVFGSKVSLMFITYEPVPEAHEIFKRFGNVFEQTYTRFLDLQKAEAQAVQAQLNLIQIQTEKKRAEEALAELQQTQKQLIQAEKMASLGELTAGIAHEIQNPLNFVNNFSEVSNELLDEMVAEVARGNFEEVKAIAGDIKQNLEKVAQHGRRADGIVKGMLQHSRSNNGQKEPTDINALADEYLRLAYHGLRAKDKSFNAMLKTDYDESIGAITIVPQDIGRVLLNLFNNAFYAVHEHLKKLGDSYKPTVSVSTKKLEGKIAIRVQDNGMGISKSLLDKIFQPFFTTKPTGQGTGLGLSLSYDIVKAHGGELKAESKEGEGATFLIVLNY